MAPPSDGDAGIDSPDEYDNRPIVLCNPCDVPAEAGGDGGDATMDKSDGDRTAEVSGNDGTLGADAQTSDATVDGLAGDSAGDACGNAMCGFTCDGSYTNCAGSCTDLTTDHGNCGRCGNPCATGQQCVNGGCQCNATSCASGCCGVGGECVPYGAGQNSGSCGTGGSTCAPCLPGTVCNTSGQCVPPPTWCALQTIPSGVAVTDYQCIDFDTGLPATNTWAQTQVQAGSLSLRT
jgi:hypothetical protein